MYAKAFAMFLVVMSLVACNKVPREIIQPEEMARLMADIHTGEAVVDMNRRSYPTDSLKQAFKQSVYMHHGYTSEQVDSSLMWYGRHLNRYMDVYDRTIEILEQRITETGNRVAAEAAMSIAGDSVDVWPYTRYLSVNSLAPTRYITFRFSADENWQPGDVYTWRAKVFNNANSEWAIAAEYAGGTVESVHSSFTGDGQREISFRTDSTQRASRIYGYMYLDGTPGITMRIDSLELIRKRLEPARYSERYRQRSVKAYAEPDSITTDTITAE